MTTRRERLDDARLSAGASLGDAPADLDRDARAAWYELVAAAPDDVIAASDLRALALCAQELAHWRQARAAVSSAPPGRRCDPDDEQSLRASLRGLYRALGDFFIPMWQRRRLLFPARH